MYQKREVAVLNALGDFIANRALPVSELAKRTHSVFVILHRGDEPEVSEKSQQRQNLRMLGKMEENEIEEDT